MREKNKISDSEYSAVHHWLKKNFGVASKCESNLCYGGSTRFDWAKKRGKSYTRNRKNFWMLCKSCHGFYDVTDMSRKLSRDNNQNTKKTACKYGHPFTSENTRIRTDNGRWRSCRECGRIAGRKYRLERKQRKAKLLALLPESDK